MERPSNWLKVSIHHPPDAAEALSALLFEEEASGVWEDLPDRLGRMVTRAGFDVSARPGLEKRLPEMIAAVADSFGLPVSEFEHSLEVEVNHDWAEKWKEGLKPISVSPGLAIAPTWWPEDDQPEAEVVLKVDPGLAFGSGHHATTFLCLTLLSEMAGAAASILDVGAGSGILSMAAAAINPGARVVGVDNDLDTIAVAEENAALNNLPGLEFSGKDLSELGESFDLIVANITLNPLVGLAPLISARAGDNGRLILSGLLQTQAEEAAAEYGKHGWQLQSRLDRDEWSALVLARVQTAEAEE
ncbi:50S ribosomal protein L11 methyltransferase [Deltaproteobacteria bacterium Smac51]|nr:50S ribosomal protein L11 methyltransferase [Deltaproteobacteria bacterium Smac51]